MSTNHIVCAALRKDDILIAGPRHFDKVMRSQIEAIGKGKGYFADAEQGFIDKYGDFWSRAPTLIKNYVSKIEAKYGLENTKIDE
jgi:hypothetical protein